MVRCFDGCSTILDLGCGTGEFLMAAKKRGKYGFGIDAYAEAVHACTAKGLLAEQWGVHDYLARNRGNLTRFDGVYCAHVIEHLVPEKVFELFKLLYDATAPGTRVVFVTPNFADIDIAGSVFWMDLTHIRPYPGLLVARMLEAVGFHKAAYTAVYGLGINRSVIKNYLLQKIRFGDRVYKPNLIITATR